MGFSDAVASPGPYANNMHTDNRTITSSLNFLQASCSSWCETNSVKALKAHSTTLKKWLKLNFELKKIRIAGAGDQMTEDTEVYDNFLLKRVAVDHNRMCWRWLVDVYHVIVVDAVVALPHLTKLNLEHSKVRVNLYFSFVLVYIYTHAHN